MPFQFMDVEKLYAKDSSLKREDVKAFAEWMKKQPHLPKATELQLILFLHSCYYRLEAAKVAIDNYFTFRTLCPDLFGAPSIETLKEQLSISSISVLPKQTPEGYTVVVLKLLDTNPDHYDPVKQINCSNLCFTLLLHQHGYSNGIVTILDMKGTTLRHSSKLNLTASKKQMLYLQEAAPVRIKGVHYINVVPFIDKVLAVLKPFIKKELFDLLHFHTESIDSLFKFIPKEIMPEDYGGQGPSLAKLHEQTSTTLLENMDFFKWIDTLKVDENKRPGKAKNAGDIFGVDGTFKKLEID